MLCGPRRMRGATTPSTVAATANAGTDATSPAARRALAGERGRVPPGHREGRWRHVLQGEEDAAGDVTAGVGLARLTPHDRVAPVLEHLAEAVDRHHVQVLRCHPRHPVAAQPAGHRVLGIGHLDHEVTAGPQGHGRGVELGGRVERCARGSGTC